MSKFYDEGGKEMAMKANYLVMMTDNFMSGWGLADNKINKYIICCSTIEQANQIMLVAERKECMSGNIIVLDLPKRLINDKYLLSIENYDDLGSIWTEGVKWLT